MYLDASGRFQVIDVLRDVYGIQDAAKIADLAIPVEWPFPEEPLTFRVMNPAFCLVSKAHNLVAPWISTQALENTQGQLRAAIRFTRAYLEELFSAGVEEHTRAALNWCRRLEKSILLKKSVGQQLYRLHGIDAFDAIPCPKDAPADFQHKGYPEMKRRWEKMKAGASRQ